MISADKRPYDNRVVAIVVGISWGAVAFAYAGSVIGTTLGQPSFITYMGLDHDSNAEGLIGTITGLFYTGGIFGCLFNSWAADALGRKWTVIIACVILVVSTACLAGSVNLGMFIAFRFFAGLGAYMLYLTVPLWVTELVPPKGRGVLAGISGLAGVVGYILAAYVGVGFFYYNATDSSQWRVPVALGCFPCLVLLAIMPWLPESPRWLLYKGRDVEAQAIISKLHTGRDDTRHEYAQAEFYQMKHQRDLERSLDSSWLEILRRPSYRKRALIACSLPMMLYSTGNLVVTTYAAKIFSGIGFDAGGSLQLLAGTYVAAILGNCISLTYVDRIPRNVIFAVGILAVTVVLSIETSLTASFLETKNESGLAAAAAFIFLYLFTFNLFLEGPSWYYASEIFPTHLRAKGMTIAVTGFCLVDIVWLELAPTAFATIGWRFYLVFIAISVFSVALIYLTFPDTLNKPLEEVARLFGDYDSIAIMLEDVHLVDGKQTAKDGTEHIKGSLAVV